MVRRATIEYPHYKSNEKDKKYEKFIPNKRDQINQSENKSY